MRLLSKGVLQVLLVLGLALVCAGLKCHQCSKSDGNCEGETDCSTITPPALPASAPPSAVAAYQSASAKREFVCAKTQNKNLVTKACSVKVPGKELNCEKLSGDAIICLCDTDLCNKGIPSAGPQVLLPLVAGVLVTAFSQYKL